MELLSRLYAFMHWSNTRRFLAFSASTWLRALPFVLFFFGFFRGWPLSLTFFWLLLGVALVIVYLWGRRIGYKRFVPDTSLALNETMSLLDQDERVPVRATGVFSLKEEEDYVLEHDARYWRVPFGDHVVMVEYQPGRYAYQIIEQENVHKVQPGYFLFGRRPKKALALRFTVTWGPDFAEEEAYDASPSANGTDPKEDRTIYFTFNDVADLQLVWRSLLHETKR